MSKRLFKTMAAVLAIAAAAAGPVRGQNASPDVTLDFTDHFSWDIPTSGTTTATESYTNGTYSITLSATSNYRLNSGYLLLGKNDSYLQLPAFESAVDSIVVVGRSGASGNVNQNIYVGETAVSTPTTGATGTNTYVIDANYRAAGNIYTLKVDNGYNTQITYIKVYYASSGGGSTPEPEPEPAVPITVRMAEGTEEAANWSIASGNASVTGTQVLENVMSGSELTATYSGNRKVKSVKAVKYVAEPVSLIVNPVVGQVIGSDGKNYDANATLPTGVTAVAKIAYVGSDNGEDAPYNHGLALALSDVSSSFYTWCSQTTATCLGTGHQFDSKADAKGDLAGIANTDALVNNAPAGHTHDAASAARNYNSGTHPTGTSEWFLPSAGQWDKMATAAGGYGTLKTNAGLQSDYYWSSSESSSADKAWYVYSTDGFWTNGYKDNGARVRACLAF